MGIHTIHILTQPRQDVMAAQARIVLEEKLIAAHHRGEHPVGSMRRECPLCRVGR